jgi:hypothetical protein
MDLMARYYTGVAILSHVGNYWWSGYSANVSWAAWNVQTP